MVWSSLIYFSFYILASYDSLNASIKLLSWRSFRYSSALARFFCSSSILSAVITPFKGNCPHSSFLLRLFLF